MVRAIGGCLWRSRVWSEWSGRAAVLTGTAAQALFDLTWRGDPLAPRRIDRRGGVFATLRSTQIRRSLPLRSKLSRAGVTDGPIAISYDRTDRLGIEIPDRGGSTSLFCCLSDRSARPRRRLLLPVAVNWVFARRPCAVGPVATGRTAGRGPVSRPAPWPDVIGGAASSPSTSWSPRSGSRSSAPGRQPAGFDEGLAFRAQITLFIGLGLLVFPRELTDVAVSGLALALLLVFLIRPAVVWLSTVFNDFTGRERLLLGLGRAERGGADRPGHVRPSSQVETANTIFNAVFFVVVVSAILQGTTLERVAGKLDLISPAGRRTSPDRGREVEPVGSPRLRRRARSCDRRFGRPRGRTAASRDHRGDRARRRLDPAPRQHDHRARRPPVRPRTSCLATRGRGRLLALAAEGLGRRYPGEMPKVEHLVYGDRKVFTVSAFNRGIGTTSAGCPPSG